MESLYDRLITQIDAFIRKYYINQLIRGVLLFAFIFLVSFLLTSSLEFIGRFGSVVRAVLFFSFIAINVYIGVFYLLIPLSRLVAFGKRINHIQAAEIIGSFFPEISDRLKNTLELQRDLDQQVGNLELLHASVQQRAQNLSVIPFQTAIRFEENKKYLKWLLPVLGVFILIAFFIPNLLTQASKRVVYYNQEFKEPAPYRFYFSDLPSQVEEGQDVPIEVTLIPKGAAKELPKQLYLVSDQGKFLMKQVLKNKFTARLKKIRHSTSFYTTTLQFDSRHQFIEVTGKALIGKLIARCHYPAYLEKADESIPNASDLTVPEGTQIEWEIQTKNTSEVKRFSASKLLDTYAQNHFFFKQTVRLSSQTTYLLKNKFTKQQDTVLTKLAVIQDAHPSIEVEQSTDSTNDGVYYFNGQLADDYGLSSLQFVYQITNASGQTRTQRMNVQAVGGTQDRFRFAVDFKRENVQLNDVITYYFVVYDNDGVNGHKATKSQEFTYELPSLEELNEQRKEDQEKSKDELQELLKKTQSFQKDIQQLKKESMNAKSTDWNKLNKVQELKEQQQELQQSLQELKEEMNESLEQKNQLSPLDQELLEKQEMIEKLLQDLMDDELKKLLEDLEKLLQEQNKEGLKEKMDELNQSSEDMKKQLDRSLEMLKKMQLNERIDDIEKELKDLAQEQEELKDAANELSKEELLKKQEELKTKFDALKKELSEIKTLNKALEKPMDLGEALEELEQQVDQELTDAKSSIEEGKNKKAGEHQKKASDGMKSMAAQLDSKQKQANQKQQEEDVESLRAILESLMTLSFDQESLMYKFEKISTKDPIYRKLGRRQQRIIDDTKLVRDSLFALAKRQPKIASFIDAEIHSIETNQKMAIEAIDDHKKKELQKHQQLVMTSYNNLALLLNEALQSMQQQMNSEQQGSGSCNNPGKGRPKSGQSMNTGDMKEMLKKQLEQLQKGPNPGGQKPGDKPGDKPGQNGQNGQSMLGLGNKEIAKMAAEQTAIRQRLEQLRQELNKEGKGLGNQLNPLIKELEEQERDLLNRNINQKTIERQHDILTRLLESDKALMERGFEDKRESKSAKDASNGNQIRFEQYNKAKWKELELLKSADPSLKKYYKEKANQYFIQ